MKILISPAKRLNTKARGGTQTPRFLKDAQTIAACAQTLDIPSLATLMDISDTLAEQAYHWLEDWTHEGGWEAGALFDGDVHTHLDYPGMSKDLKSTTQNHVRILSGLYGLLRPHDTIAPYRLEMGRKLKVGSHPSLYKVWGEKIGHALNQETDTVVNLASTEYFKAVQGLETQLITPVFLEDRGKGPKVVAVNAKRARGAMARHLVEHGLKGLEDFSWNGYTYQGQSEDGHIWLKKH